MREQKQNKSIENSKPVKELNKETLTEKGEIEV